MFEQTVTLLLSGEFICNVRYPDAWRFLADEAQRKDVDAFLGRLDRRLASTRQGGAWFAAYQQIGGDERRVMREVVRRHQAQPAAVWWASSCT